MKFLSLTFLHAALALSARPYARLNGLPQRYEVAQARERAIAPVPTLPIVHKAAKPPSCVLNPHKAATLRNRLHKVAAPTCPVHKAAGPTDFLTHVPTNG